MGIGYATLHYIDHKLFDSFTKNKIFFSFTHFESENTAESKGEIRIQPINHAYYSLLYSHSLGAEKEIIKPFSLGVEAELFRARVFYANYTRKLTSDTRIANEGHTGWKVDTQLLGSFKVYAKLIF